MPRYSDATLRLTLRQGTVYYCQDRRLTSSEPHYFIVCNRDPLTDKVMLLACSSSQIANVRARRCGLPAQTLVEIRTQDYVGFRKDSIIDCNTLFETTRQDVLTRLNAGEIELKSDMSPSVMARVHCGIAASPLIPAEQKRLV